MITQAQIGELAAKAFDQLNAEYEGFTPMDAVLLIELMPPGEMDDDVSTRGDVIISTTTERVSVLAGVLQQAFQGIVAEVPDDE